MTTTKRNGGEVRFLATKALVGGLSVAAFLGAWVAIAATAGGAGAGTEMPAPGGASSASSGPAAIERQVIYYIVGAASDASQLPSAPPAAAQAAPQQASPAAPKQPAVKSTAKKSRGS